MTLAVAVRLAGAVLVNTVGAGPAEGWRAGAVCRAVRGGAAGWGAASAAGTLVNTVGSGPGDGLRSGAVGALSGAVVTRGAGADGSSVNTVGAGPDDGARGAVVTWDGVDDPAEAVARSDGSSSMISTGPVVEARPPDPLASSARCASLNDG